MVKARRQTASTNARVIAAELDWLEGVLTARFAAYGRGGEGVPPPSPDIAPPPSLESAKGPYAEFVRDLDLDPVDRLILALALTPYVAPERLDPFLLQNAATGRRFTEFGGLIGQSHGGFLPTAETAMFLLSGGDLALRIAPHAHFEAHRPLRRSGVLALDHQHADEPPMSAALRLSSSGLARLLRGADDDPEPSPDFPAARVTTPLDWEDLVLDAPTMRQIEVIGLWIAHERTLMEDWGLARRLKPGYRCLFHGGPGTGKTLTACLLGKRHGLPVYRVDLSRVVSKWIGETEKNLAALFDQAQDRGWILFFDEADALFGKRTESRSANDRSANQQIAYLLQRLETYSGLTILATNQSAHMDEAFTRRFQSSIAFPMPDALARERLWRETFASRGFTLSPEIDFRELAARHELAGGAIINVLRFAALMAVKRDPARVELQDLIDGVRLEMQKDGRYLNR